MRPVIEAFMAAHQLPDVTVVANSRMVWEANQQQIEAAGLSLVLGSKIQSEPTCTELSQLGARRPSGRPAQPRPGHPHTRRPEAPFLTRPRATTKRAAQQGRRQDAHAGNDGKITTARHHRTTITSIHAAERGSASSLLYSSLHALCSITNWGSSALRSLQKTLEPSTCQIPGNLIIICDCVAHAPWRQFPQWRIESTDRKAETKRVA